MLNVDFVIYVPTIETDIVFVCVIKALKDIGDVCFDALRDSCSNFMGLAHIQRQNSHPEINGERSCALSELIPFWTVFINCVKDNDPLPPSKLSCVMHNILV